jgi:uncharacterized protein YbjT (DUF2867 family)
MSSPVRICLVGSTGLTGWTLIQRAVGRTDVRLIAMSRRHLSLPEGARMVVVVSEPEGWPEAIAETKTRVLVCALGTTMRKVGNDEAEFRAVDHDLVLMCARAAKAAGIEHMIVVSSVGAAPGSKNFYLRVKGETEEALAKLRFRRLDILRPGLLRGPRGELRLLERLGMWFSPLIDLFLRGKNAKYRSIRVEVLADAIFALAKEKVAGRFVHEHEAILYALRRRGG